MWYRYFEHECPYDKIEVEWAAKIICKALSYQK